MRYLNAALTLCLLAAPLAEAQSKKATIAVAPFDLHQGVRAKPNVHIETDTLTQKFVGSLVRTRKFDVVERSKIDTLLQEMKLGETGLMDPARAAAMGKALGADFFVMGEITIFEYAAKRIQAPISKEWALDEELRLHVDMRIVNTNTTKVTAAETGSAVYKGRTKTSARPELDGGPSKVAIDQIQRDVVEALVIKVINAVYPVRVIGVNANGVVSINRGEGGGINVGEEYDVFTEGEELVDPDTGEVLGSEETKIGRIRVDEILAKFSKCSILAGSPARGNLCRPASGDVSAPPPPPPPPPSDTLPPVIRILAPQANSTLSGNPINVVCEVTDNEGVARVTISGQDATATGGNRWSGKVRAASGGNLVRVAAWDHEGNKAEAQVTFNYDETPPGVEADARILVEGKVDDLGCTLTINGQRVDYDKSTGQYSARVPPNPENPGQVVIVATDEFGNQTKEIRNLK
ncbi:MAG: CsgG/HfaB family protein [Planctomycetota bacterium]